MAGRVGDVVFMPSGRPAVVTESDRHSGKLVTTDDPAVVREKHRHGYINGLDVEQRNQFAAFLDRIKTIPEPEKRVEELQGRIKELSGDPSQHRLMKYLTAEMAHIMHTSGIRPKVYEIDVDKVS